MSGHHKFQILRDQMGADPKRRAEVEKIKRAYDVIYGLAALHADRGGRKQSAAKFGVSQTTVAEVERQEDLCLSTLAQYVAMLGGRLEVTAVFPDQRIKLGVPGAGTQGNDVVDEQVPTK